MSKAPAAVLILVLGFGSVGCGELTLADRRVVLVGIDGADWRLIDPLIEAGRLPNFATIRNGGKTGVLETRYSSASPSIWNSIATGMLPAKHGIRDFVVRSPTSYYELPVTRYQRRAAALWNILDHHGRRSCVIAWWASWPAEEIEGCIVSQRFFLSSFGIGPIGGPTGIGVGGENPDYAADAAAEGLTWPPALASQLRDHLVGSAAAGAARSPLGLHLAALSEAGLHPGLRHPVAVLENILATDRLVRDSALALVDWSGPFDLQALYLEAVDVASHLFWKHRFPASWRAIPPEFADLPADLERYAPIVDLAYEEVDEILGVLLQQLEPGAILVLASDHGFTSDLNPYGYSYPANRMLEASGLLESIEGRVDFARTTFFDHGSEPWSRDRELQLNLVGRYPLGSVDPGDAGERLAALEALLTDLETDSGRRVVVAAQRLQEQRGLAISINRRLPRGDAVSIRGSRYRISDLFPPRGVSGNHRSSGIVGFYGDGITPARIPPLSSLQLAPTLLALLGVPAARDMDGEPFAALVQELGGEISTVESYDFLVERATPREPASEVDESLRDRLRALGYIE